MTSPILTLTQEKEARADRLKRARALAGLSRKEMGEGESAIHADTYKGWEIARFGGLTEKGAQKVVEKLMTRGVNCSINWLMHGIGVSPFQDHAISSEKLQSVDVLLSGEADQISRELSAFMEQKNAIHFSVMEDWMGPYYLPGDVVAGLKLTSSDQIREGIEAIVQLDSGELLLRKIYQTSEKGRYHLLTHRPEGPVLTSVSLAFIAPVLWWRRSLKTVLSHQLERGENDALDSVSG